MVGLTLTAKVNAQCEGMAENSFVPNPRGCNYYYLCQNNQAIEDSCPEGYWFRGSDQTCRTPGDFCSEPRCRGVANGKFVENTEGGCGAWEHCENDVTSHDGVCPDSLTFHENLQICTYPKCGEVVEDGDIPVPAPGVPVPGVVV